MLYSQLNIELTHLHSTIFILILQNLLFYVTIYKNLHSTIFILILVTNCTISNHHRNLHSTIFILILT